MKHTVIYVPGLGDRNLRSRKRLLSLWHYRNVSVEICSMDWSIDEPWPAKLQRLLNQIDALHYSGQTICLVGESAGASSVVQALAQRPEYVSSTVLLCGKSQYPERVAAWRYQQNPALKDALIASSKAIGQLSVEQKRKLLNLHPLYDPTVPVAETKISGVKNAVMPIIGHATSIVFANTLWSWRIVSFVKKLR